jgi:hypothetical protein
MNYPKAPDKKLQKLSNLLVRYAESEGLDFSFGEEQVYSLETFAHFGCLSLFLIEAKEQYEKIYNKFYTIEELMQPFGRQISKLTVEQTLIEQTYLDKQKKQKIFPIEFHEQEEDTYFGFIPRLSQSVPSDFVLLAHFAHYSLEEYVKIYKKNKMLLVDGRIPLDPLYDKMVKKINMQQVQIRQKVMVTTPELGSENKSTT